MQCDYQAVCPFFWRKTKIEDASYQQLREKYCEGTKEECALFAIMSEASFLAVPLDLMPDQVHRVYQIISNSIYGG